MHAIITTQLALIALHKFDDARLEEGTIVNILHLIGKCWAFRFTQFAYVIHIDKREIERETIDKTVRSVV